MQAPLPMLSALANLRNVTVTFATSVRPHGTTRLPLGGFSWNLKSVFRRSVQKIQVPLNSDKNSRYFTWRPIYIYMHCATRRTVPGSIPGGVTGDFFLWFPPTEPCALGSTQPLEMSTRDLSWGKGGRCVELTTYHPCSAESQEIRGLNLPGTPWATSACRGTPLLLYMLMSLDRSFQ